MLTTDSKSSDWFTAAELRATGVAATLMVVLGTIVVVGITIAFGHYNSLLHAGPKAVADALAIGLLLGAGRRWRCMALLGVVYGLVMLLQIGLIYVSVMMMLAGLGAAAAGRVTRTFGSTPAVLMAAVVFELLAGFTAPIKILLATNDGREPVLWMLWLAEWPLRIGGAAVGVMLSRKLARSLGVNLARRSDAPPEGLPAATRSAAPSPRTNASKSWHAPVALTMVIIAGTLPMVVQSWFGLAILAAVFFGYGYWYGLRRALLNAFVALAWGCITFAAASFLWHRDADRVVDLGRTFALRFWPMTVAAVVIARCVRPIAFVRLLRQLRLPAIILLPLMQVARSIPRARRDVERSLASLQINQKTHGVASMLRRPLATTRAVLQPLIWRFARELGKHADPVGEASCRVGESTVAKGAPL